MTSNCSKWAICCNYLARILTPCPAYLCSLKSILSKTSSTAAEAEAEVVYEWSRLEYEIARDPGILADKYRVRRLFESCVLTKDTLT